MCFSWILQLTFGHIDGPNIFTFRESILFTKVINLIVLLPVFGSIVVYLPLMLNGEKPTKSNTKATVRPKCLNKSNVAKETDGEHHTRAHTHRCTWNIFDDTHRKSGSHSRPTDLYQHKMSMHTHTHTYWTMACLLFKCSKSNFSFSQSKTKNGKHPNKADNSDRLTRTNNTQHPGGNIRNKKRSLC